ncbi:hypothetical protein SNE510_24800 [Streptomyces sp. NE5-10]|nr:hypothetical protein SNE510_24800 [Streptomyces sp. NE5-10]
MGRARHGPRPAGARTAAPFRCGPRPGTGRAGGGAARTRARGHGPQDRRKRGPQRAGLAEAWPAPGGSAGGSVARTEALGCGGGAPPVRAAPAVLDFATTLFADLSGDSP